MPKNTLSNSPGHDLATPLFANLDDAGNRVAQCNRSIRRAISNGELTGYKFGRSLRVRIDELDAWAASKAMAIPRRASRGAFQTPGGAR